MKTLTTFALIVILCALGTACSKSGTSSGRGNTDPSGAPTALGTVSGGGGNGLDDKAIESYSIKIEELPEYQRYVGPVIKKISRGSGDVLTVYMNYVVHQKPWYLIPVDLEQVPKERVGLAFKTEQLALQSEGAIYLHKISYYKKNQRQRADLLMHEIIMGVRLLMKKSPSEQCEKLGGTEVRGCKDAEMMRLAQAQNFDAKDQLIMDETDHDAVRALTVFLMQLTNEVNSETVAMKRRQLKFLFPWDQLVSNLKISDVVRLLRRANLSDSVFRPTDAPAAQLSGLDVRCRFTMPTEDSSGTPFDIFETAPLPLADTVRISYSTSPFEWAGAPANFARFRDDYVIASPQTLTARGVVEPPDGNQILDLVTLTPEFPFIDLSSTSSSQNLSQLEILISREDEPRVVEIRSRSIKVSRLIQYPKSLDDLELVPDTKIKLRCRLSENK